MQRHLANHISCLLQFYNLKTRVRWKKNWFGSRTEEPLAFDPVSHAFWKKICIYLTHICLIIYVLLQRTLCKKMWWPNRWKLEGSLHQFKTKFGWVCVLNDPLITTCTWQMLNMIEMKIKWKQVRCPVNDQVHFVNAMVAILPSLN